MFHSRMEIYRLLTCVLLCQAASGETSTHSYSEPTEYEEIDEAVLSNGGTGESETKMNKLFIDMEDRKRNLTSKHSDETNIQENQKAYTEWLKVCAFKDDIPRITKQVTQYMKFTNMSEEELIQRCNQMKIAKREITNTPIGQHGFNGEHDTGNTDGKSRKRFIAGYAGVWDKCIIPFKFHDNYNQERRRASLRTIDLFHQKTGFRFVVYNDTNAEMGLTHDNYLIFYTDPLTDVCESQVGNQRVHGQLVAACYSFEIVLHELGHALGFEHEHNDPERVSFAKANYDNIPEHMRKTYLINNIQDITDKVDKMFDLTSIMLYPNMETQKGYGLEMTIDEPELTPLIGSHDYFYMFKELQEYHSCYDEFSSCSASLECKMDGYKSVINGKCACACPEGLDSSTKCSTIKNDFPVTKWPAGTFTLLLVKRTTCPMGMSSGQMARWHRRVNHNTEGLLSIRNEGDFKTVLDVCTQTTSSGGGEWPKGEYCMLKRGSCPQGFEEGVFGTWGMTPKGNSTFGALPDGKKGQNLEFWFCCRGDGVGIEPIKLPQREPFVMYANNTDCQKVNGMAVYKEKYIMPSYYKNENHRFSGALPLMEEGDNKYLTWIFYCVYIPVNLDGPCGAVKKFTEGETSFTFKTPNYPYNYPVNKECFWHFESPESTTMKIDFSDFQVSTPDDECLSYVELKTLRPGMKGYRICGHHQKKTRLTAYNRLAVKFVSAYKAPQKGFKATVTVLKEEEKCYPDDGMDSYVGTVNYTQSMRPCLPWSQVTNCALNQFAYETMDLDLNHNYCRTVKSGRMPWCYVNQELCEFENCDACMRDNCYDVLPGCASIVQQDSTFCSKNELGEARRGCMKTCGYCDEHKQAPAYNKVTCPVPDDVNGISPVPIKTSYEVGDYVDYKCPTSDVVRDRECQSDGTWSHIGYVCSGCSYNWKYVRGKCYEWQLESLTRYEDAYWMCNEINSTLLVVESDEQLDGVMGLTSLDKLNNNEVWFGLKFNDGRWEWEDGTVASYISWKDENDVYEDECVTGTTPNTWHTMDCDYEKEVICTKTPTGDFECDDDLPNCDDILTKNPGLCEEYPDYAWTNCRKTCGITGCPEISSCNVQTVANAKQVHGSSKSVKQGQYVEYMCNDGYLLKSGNLNRTCLAKGIFNGNEPVCSAPGELESITLFADVELFRRKYYSDLGYISVANLDTTRITVAGKITAWTFFASEAGEVTMLVFRPNAQNVKEFMLVGKNTLDVTADSRAVIMKINIEDQIQAEEGDVIGLLMPTPVITYSRCNEENMPLHAPWMESDYKHTASTLNTGEAIAFGEYNDICRVYSIRVTLDPTE